MTSLTFLELISKLFKEQFLCISYKYHFLQFRRSYFVQVVFLINPSQLPWSQHREKLFSELPKRGVVFLLIRCLEGGVGIYDAI